MIHSIQAMQVAPEPIETIAQKGARFKTECAQKAKIELAKKQEHVDRFSIRYHDLDEDDIKELAHAEITRCLKDKIKESFKAIFPQALRLGRPVELNNFLETEADRYLKEAEEEQAVRAAKKCSWFSLCRG
jgi:hypothetical protein